MSVHGSSDHDLAHPGQTPYLLTMLRRLVNYQVSLGALVEMALVCAIPYLAIGAIVAGAHGEGLRQVQVEQGHDALVTFVASLISWPVLLFSHSCAT
ncbi:hypothetical protein BMW24_011040 [Mycobacterium heckeshornense]|uniref:Uncharacterized protein n=1 Tax=Mycobacterium heckeshornense TaxID=110505 RepID=A0A2G8B9W5_9MYCO|nr:hypothetical protein [Mycobacterium heckeshornense]MCV7034185.1 hypothetical protein [Mycobacterium heckeshornense]PIJ34551.1 hypothetical protein BMW24_011040 [Mycobacterium heckeshornense]BCO36861.1 hypothetical protein MHEC_32940 [Mycobacterium heckeshornense]